MRDKEKDLEHRLVHMQPSYAEQGVGEAVTALGYDVGRDAVNVFVEAKREYRRTYRAPYHGDAIQRKLYNLEMDQYAIVKVRLWIEEKKAEGAQEVVDKLGLTKRHEP